ncbi:MAG TPA: FAD-dependent monooxygenase [Geminicoccaceae bacterium]|nr:FAD-dependent monooxygenase [Geminicoccaceae bacterium]
MPTLDDSAATPRPLSRAVVVGGGIAGLLAARVLADHCERVTLVERDAPGDAPCPRKGVPQGSHVHALLVRGRSIMEVLFPGLTQELRAAGAVVVNAGAELAWYHTGGRRVRHDSDLNFLAMSRPLLEWRLAGRVRALPNVAIRPGERADGWATDGRGRVTGVRVRGAGQGEILDADLVVDATGRGSSTPERLAALGFDAPEAELLPTRVAYASCLFRRRDLGQTWRALVVTGAPLKRSGLVFPVEGDRWLVTLPAFFDEPMPRDHATFAAFARSLPVPDVHAAIVAGEPLSGIANHRFPGSLRRRYERLERLPQGLIALGDAVCSFNPVYGQGMTVAAVEAELLGQALARARCEGGIAPDFGRRWFRDLKPIVDRAWRGVSLEDFRFPELADRRPARLRPLQWYMRRVHLATHRSARVTDQFYRVMNFLDPPTALFRPRILAEVLRSGPAGTGAPAARSAAPFGPKPPAHAAS